MNSNKKGNGNWSINQMHKSFPLRLCWFRGGARFTKPPNFPYSPGTSTKPSRGIIAFVTIRLEIMRAKMNLALGPSIFLRVRKQSQGWMKSEARGCYLSLLSSYFLLTHPRLLNINRRLRHQPQKVMPKKWLKNPWIQPIWAVYKVRNQTQSSQCRSNVAGFKIPS